MCPADVDFIPYRWDLLKLHGGGGHGVCHDNFLSMSHVPGTVPRDMHSIHSILLIPIMLTTHALPSPITAGGMKTQRRQMAHPR